MSIDREDVEKNEEEQEYRELNVTLHLKKNIAELLRILSICYSDYSTHNNEMLSSFISWQITKIIENLAVDPPNSEKWPENFKIMLKNILNEDKDPSKKSVEETNNEDLK